MLRTEGMQRTGVVSELLMAQRGRILLGPALAMAAVEHRALSIESRCQPGADL